jgi:NADPH:quinone reductase-like Zn-dependent oxidoreductase
MPGPGTIADTIIVAAASVVAKPAHLAWDEAACVPLAGLTAWRALFTKAALKRGERLLVTGAGGGVATFAVLFGAAIGAQVHVTSSSDATITKAVALGAAAGFNYRSENWRTKLPRSSQGFNVVLDSAPASGYPAYSRSLATGARVVICGSTGGVSFPVNAPEVFLKNLHIIGSNAGTLAEFENMLGFIATHKIKPVIDRRFPLEQAKEALMHLEKGHAFGKVVITV